MKRLILKFGGTSVGTVEKIKKVANIIKKRLNLFLERKERKV